MRILAGVALVVLGGCLSPASTGPSPSPAGALEWVYVRHCDNCRSPQPDYAPGSAIAFYSDGTIIALGVQRWGPPRGPDLPSGLNASIALLRSQTRVLDAYRVVAGNQTRLTDVRIAEEHFHTQLSHMTQPRIACCCECHAAVDDHTVEPARVLDLATLEGGNWAQFESDAGALADWAEGKGPLPAFAAG